MAVMISMQAYEQFTRQREKDFAALYKIWNKVPDLPESDIEPAILEVRAKDEIPSNRSGVKQEFIAVKASPRLECWNRVLSATQSLEIKLGFGWKKLILYIHIMIRIAN